MKNIVLKLTFTISILIGIVSCSDYLEQEAATVYDPQSVFENEESVEVAVNGLYSSIADPEYYGSSVHALLNPHSGMMYSSQTANADAVSLGCGTNNTWLTRLWPQMFKTIDVANNIIANVQDTELANKDLALGQAYFIRAVTYFDLVRLFGGVPLRTTPVTSENLYLPRAPKDQVYAQIIEDFNLAKELLPEAGEYRSDRPLKWAAYGYLAKVYMQLAGEDGGNPANWQNAWNEAIVVYNKYSLYPNYGQMFAATNWAEKTTESIFELPYEHFGTIRNSDRVRQYTPSRSTFTDTNFPTFGWIRPNKEIFDQHNSQYPGDPRIAATYLFGSYQRWNTAFTVLQNVNIYPNNSNGNNGYPYIKKWFDTTYNGTTTAKNHTLFRYADLLLMLAEIENEINGPGNAYQYVNEVLSRARNSVSPASTIPADWSGLSQADFRDRIMQERKYELFSEGQDWFDARRRGYQYFLDKVINVHNNHPTINVGNNDFIYPSDVKNMLLPIPQTEIGNNPNISETDQNPGY